jgi:DNA-binding transcriptional MerR regulator
MRISEFARSCGVHPATIRRLEAQGHLAPQRDWRGHRRYTEADIAEFKQRFLRGKWPTAPRRAEEQS